MRYLILALTIGLTSCAALPKATSQSNTINSANGQALPPQNLTLGECAFFGWSVEADPRLIFFAAKDRALYAAASGQVNLTALDDALPAKTYSRDNGAPLEINLGGNIKTGPRGTQYPSASIKTQDIEGWDKLIPMAGLQYCKEA